MWRTPRRSDRLRNQNPLRTMEGRNIAAAGEFAEAEASGDVAAAAANARDVATEAVNARDVAAAAVNTRDDTAAAVDAHDIAPAAVGARATVVCGSPNSNVRQQQIIEQLSDRVKQLESQLQNALPPTTHRSENYSLPNVYNNGSYTAYAPNVAGAGSLGNSNNARTTPISYVHTINMPPVCYNVSVPPINTNSAQPPQLSNQYMGLYTPPLRKLQDLPEFSGCPEDWPMFYAAFTHTTQAYGYTNLENNQRLQKCLKGEAKNTVKCLLIHPDNVPNIIQQLSFRFGRPEQLIDSQLRSVREVQAITENTIERIVPFATKVRNLAVFLQTLNNQQHLSNPTLLENLVGKLPMTKRMEWARHAKGLYPYPTIVHFSDWINEIADLVLTLQEHTTRNGGADSKRRVILHAVEQTRNRDCAICQGQHKVVACQQFIAETVPKRWEMAKRCKLCFLCLNTGHMTRSCTQRACAKRGCNKKHNELLHEGLATTVTHNSAGNANQSVSTEGTERAVLSCVDSKRTSILFRIIPVTLYGPSGSVDTHALLDEGASLTMMDASLISTLGLTGVKRNVNIKWIGGRVAEEPVTIVDLQISGTGMSVKHPLKGVHGIDNINLPLQSLNLNDLNNGRLRELPIQSYCHAKPMLLIGLDNCHLSLPRETVRQENGPYATKTALGWVVFGPTVAAEPALKSCLMLRSGDDDLHEIVAEHVTTESFGVRSAPKIESVEDVRARQTLRSTIQRIGGRYQLGLLWKCDRVIMPNSYEMALRRLVNVEHKMEKNNTFANAYKAIINDYVKKNYARKLEKHELSIERPRTWFLPHFAVTNPNKPGKIRLVFDAAAKVGNVSLKSYLSKGPQEFEPMPSVLFNFRIGAVAVTADIREMFHQILIRPADRNSQRFLWRDGERTREPDVYEMNVMTFGAACSPCSAQYVKVRNALSYSEVHPRAVKAIVKHHYVDDFVDSFATEAEAIAISKQVKGIHQSAGFELRRFVSNSGKVMSALGEEGPTQTELPRDENGLNTEKILGLYWHPKNDAFKFMLKFHNTSPDIITGLRGPTKRELLSITMSVFDPLGFLSHLLITAKLLMREVWRQNVGWDEQLPQQIREIWGKYLENIKQVDQVLIPRCFFPCGPPRNLQLHIFVDASEDAFSAVAYWRTVDHNDAINVFLVCAKSKCAPLKLLTVPRLELQAAVLGARLKEMLVKEHDLVVDQCIMWSDSKTVLKWIALASRRYKPFVAHRIAEIMSATDVSDWRWLPTKENVADEATRINCQTDLRPTSRWFQGPDFLGEDESKWPAHDPQIDQADDEEELAPKFVLLSNTEELISFDRFSSFKSLVRTIAQVKRFIERSRKQGYTTNKYGMTTAEVEAAEIIIYKEAQRDLTSIGNGLHMLLPYKDDNGVIRAGGRLDAASWLSLDSRRPIIIPPEHYLAKLIVMHYHNLMRHQNSEATIGEIRTRYWIPKIRQLLRKVISRCKICMLQRVKPCTPLMGPLPEDRLTPYVRPFTYTGLDYFGPLNVTIGRRQEKRWVALFTCLTIRAIHLEIAKDLSTDACIIVIRNFMNRRGVPKRLRSDNGKNFVGLANDAKTFASTFDCRRIQDELTSRHVDWVFNCPNNPSEGGIWERMVQCTKRVLRHTLKSVAPQEHTLHSLLIEAENIINSRPLTHMPVTVEQMEPLTPNHFLLGSANTMQTDLPEDIAINLPQRKQWRVAQQLRNTFWKRWVIEYLPTLTRREKWCQRTTPVRVGDLVFICDEGTSRKDWARGRIERVYKGADGEIRRADVRTNKGIARRPVNRLAVLDVE